MEVHTLIIGIIESVDTWPRAMVAVTLIIAGVLYVLVKRTRSDVQDVKKTLTSNNGGSHVKDTLDRNTEALERIEGTLTDLTARTEALEAAAASVRSVRGFFKLRR